MIGLPTDQNGASNSSSSTKEPGAREKAQKNLDKVMKEHEVERLRAERTAAASSLSQISSQNSEESETNEASTTPKKAVGRELVGKYCELTQIGKRQFKEQVLENSKYSHNAEWKKHLDAMFKIVEIEPADHSPSGKKTGKTFTRYVIQSCEITTPVLVPYSVVGSNFKVVPTPTTTTSVSNNGSSSSSSTTTGEEKITLDAYRNESTEDMEHSSCFYVYETAVQLRGQLSPLPKDTAHLLQVKATKEQWDKIFTTVDGNVETNQTLTSEYEIYDQVVMNDSEFPKYAIYSIDNKTAYLLCLEGEQEGRVLTEPQPFDSLAPAVAVESSAKKAVAKKKPKRKKTVAKKKGGKGIRSTKKKKSDKKRKKNGATPALLRKAKQMVKKRKLNTNKSTLGSNSTLPSPTKRSTRNRKKVAKFMPGQSGMEKSSQEVLNLVSGEEESSEEEESSSSDGEEDSSEEESSVGEEDDDEVEDAENSEDDVPADAFN